MFQRLSIALLALFASCYSHTHATEYNGVPGLRGEPVEYQATTGYSLNGLFIFNLIGNTSLDRMVDEFTEEASANGANRVNITQTSKTVYWYIFPPISFFVHPVSHTIEGTVEGTTTATE